ncbi:ScbA/BarX family gamma-butyrolactone biosynthesis protein [Streptomyces aureoverticillatus]|uniref:ScbA/BarX family gamma-butyrolactone biosynthesis protein n=1 Tax=Streptomyces aureoverticillatus TaxID=66871 RepID=UPI001EF99F22|nr:ScbA/BarX family gamma-butyrolactone biosynthesis protein [Streptomyces aureoverticillatus]
MLVKERPAVDHRHLTTTVAREYVHRAALSEVFLTGWEAVGDDTFRVTAQWPRCHGFYELYESGQASYDPLMLCETFRQTFPLLSHAAYGVPFGHQLTWHHLRYTLDPRAMALAAAPAEIELRVSCSDIRRRRDLPTEMTMSVEVLRDGTPFATADTRFGILTPAVYQRLRSSRGDVQRVFGAAPPPPPPITRASAGRSRRQDIVLAHAPGTGRWRLRADTTHPVLFDHAVDHVPGMLLLEAVRQAGHALRPADGRRVPVSMEAVFHHYVEFDSACWIEAQPVPAGISEALRGVRVDAVQEGRLMFSATSALADL